MADTAIWNFTDGATADATDRIAAARSSSANVYLTPAYIKTYITGLANTWASGQIGPLWIGGAAVGSTLTLKSTSGVGTTDAIIFQVGNNGATEAMRIANAGNVLVGYTTPVAAGGSITPAIQLHATGATGYGVYRWSADTGATQIQANKSRGAAIGTRGIVSSGDNLLNFNASGDDGTNFVIAASISFAVDGTPGTNDMPGRIVFNTTADGASSVTERMRIDNAGNVVINAAAIVTTATDGFLYIPTCAGTPTGVPTAYTGRIAMVYDTTNHQFWFYDSGWKQPKTPAAAAIITWQ